MMHVMCLKQHGVVVGSCQCWWHHHHHHHTANREARRTCVPPNSSGLDDLVLEQWIRCLFKLTLYLDILVFFLCSLNCGWGISSSGGWKLAFLLWTGQAGELHSFLQPQWMRCCRVSEAFRRRGWPGVGGTGWRLFWLLWDKDFLRSRVWWCCCPELRRLLQEDH